MSWVQIHTTFNSQHSLVYLFFSFTDTFHGSMALYVSYVSAGCIHTIVPCRSRHHQPLQIATGTYNNLEFKLNYIRMTSYSGLPLCGIRNWMIDTYSSTAWSRCIPFFLWFSIFIMNMNITRLFVASWSLNFHIFLNSFSIGEGEHQGMFDYCCVCVCVWCSQ